MQTVLVTGGAGYVGSHCCLKLLSAGYLPVVYDNLSTGHREFVQFGPFEPGDVRETARLTAVMRRHRPVAVLHFAADIEVGESEIHPARCFNNNVGGVASVLAACESVGVETLVFSSTCAIFGETAAPRISERISKSPESAYGLSKLMAEQMILAAEARTGLRAARLRYFNAAGADPLGRLGEAHDPETHLIPLVLDTALGLRDHIKIFGSDYPTPDGTAIRDYIHVLDLADAHVRALEHLLETREGISANLGTGQGSSVLDVIRCAEKVSGSPVSVIESDRRQGDPSCLVADPARAAALMGWAAQYDLEAIMRDAWMWHSIHRAQRLETRLAAE